MAEKFQQDDRKVMESGQFFETVEENPVVHGARRIFVQVIKTPLFDAQGKVDRACKGCFWDISERGGGPEEQIRMGFGGTGAEPGRRLRQEKRAVWRDDLRMAREIQQTMLPQQYPVFFPRDAEPRREQFSFFHHRYHPTGGGGRGLFQHPAVVGYRGRAYLFANVDGARGCVFGV